MWLLTWGDKSWSAEDLTGAHLTLIVMAIGEDSWEIAPTQGPLRLIANLAAFISLAEGKPYALALAEVQAAPAAELLAALTTQEG